jgi:hypothetical protein
VTAPLVTLDAYDFEADRTPVMLALQGLMRVHNLPQFQRVAGVHRHGWKIVVLSLDADDAESWRAALAAPGFAPNPDEPGQMLTERFWFSSWIRLVYSIPGSTDA